MKVIDLQNKITVKYFSIRKAALAVKAHHKSLIYCDKNKKLLFNKYVITIKRK